MGDKGYISKAIQGTGKALRGGVKTADGVIDTAVGIGSNTAKKAVGIGAGTVGRVVDTGKGVSDHARHVVAGKAEIEMLERLGNMWREGMLTDDEFRAAKSRILERI